MKKLIIILSILTPLCCIGQEAKAWDLSIGLGYNIGGRTPYELPGEIRSIDAFRPLLNLSANAELTRWLSTNWGIAAGLTVENKGLETGTTVKNYQITMDITSGDKQGIQSGYYSGSLTNRSQSTYLTIPLMATFRSTLESRWRFKAGLYGSYALYKEFTGEVSNGTIRETPLHNAIAIQSAVYDYSSDLKSYDIGATLGANVALYKQLELFASMQLGFVDILKSENRKINLDMYNIFLNIGLTYRL